MKTRAMGFATLIAVGALLAGCSNTQLGGGGGTTRADTTSRAAPPQIAGIALPDGYNLDSNRTIILGEGERWIGRLSYSINSSSDDMFDFVRREMINHGWTEVAVVRSEISQLTYLSGQGDRVASILINKQSLYGSKIDMTVSPAAGSTGIQPSRNTTNSRR
ncbi:hypothetical protein [Ferrovibrio sp.]|uniref:hypothetical protein n=1 Tax=Ferrovibrio sp. TaxID=1917215 RepID=UPI001B5E0354|nr:hypothetical protein [Ferrovibrio sp.]MBP7065377.1 hypothetical protein [Ferrovibrio sp.]